MERRPAKHFFNDTPKEHLLEPDEQYNVVKKRRNNDYGIVNNWGKDTGYKGEISTSGPSISKREILINSDDETNPVIRKKTKKRYNKRKRKELRALGTTVPGEKSTGELSDKYPEDGSVKPPGDGLVKTPGEKSKRRQKKERHARRQAEGIVGDQLQVIQDARDYLLQWKNDHSSWKFMKAKQIWLSKNKFDKEKIPDDIWPICNEYFTSSMGNSKKMLVDDAKRVVEEMEQWVERNSKAFSVKELGNEHDKDAIGTEDIKPSEISYERARNIIQNIEE